ncbi:MAG: D-aminoacyl-tRNA deacylase [Dehalococcoidia bacterium]
MRALVQRVSRASVAIGGEVVARIGPGLVVLLGVAQGDTPQDARALARKVAHLRVFPDQEGRFQFSLLETDGEALAVSQFTLLADTRRGRRPNFTGAAPPEQAQPLYEDFVVALSSLGVRVGTGRFQEYMSVEIINNGPVTILLDSRE